MLRGMATVSFYADDVKAARDWYAELLGVEAYFAVPTADDPQYVEFRIGDFQAELGIINAKFAPHAVGGGPAGSILYWHVDNLEASLARLLELGATLVEETTERGQNTGFITASVTEPFGNVIGIMNNPHYLEIFSATRA
jgi:predicted enzyme related to lactoylglutathione lyase